jgi:hypothetical protein
MTANSRQKPAPRIYEVCQLAQTITACSMGSVTAVLRFAVLIVALGPACSDDGESPQGSAGSGGSRQGAFLGSCDTRSVAGPSAGQCRDWSGDGTADVSVSCNGLSGTFSSVMRCPSTGRVATCSLDPVLGTSAVYGYYSPDYTLDAARDHCTALAGSFESSGSGGTGGSGSECPPECFRPYECVAACGDVPINNGCCPCPEGQIDVITCP